MSSITVLRSQVPVPAPAPAARPDPSVRTPTSAAARPVSVPIRVDAPAQVGASGAMVTARLAERDEGRHPATDARIAAEAARKAYIKASIAAGVSPLPMP